MKEKFPCPHCGQWFSRVLPIGRVQREAGAFVRVRQCTGCHQRFETVERIMRKVPNLPQHLDPQL